MSPLPERLRDAIAQGGVTTPDERGLMPLAEARRWLEAHPRFVKGEHQKVNDLYVLESDRSWAALLSLRDGDELAQVAATLSWEMQPRGFDNVDLHLRYGDAIVSWLRTRLDGGQLVNQPWCVVPCLLACSSRAAFELAWDARETLARGQRSLLTLWLEQHPNQALAPLLDEVRHGSPLARAHLACAVARGRHDALVAAIEGSDAAAVLAEVGLGTRPTRASILALLDACALGLMHENLQRWPASAPPAPLVSGPLALTALRSADASGWGLVIERPQGMRRVTQILAFLYGNRVPGGVATASVPLRQAPPTLAWLRQSLALADGSIVYGPATIALGSELPNRSRAIAPAVEALIA